MKELPVDTARMPSGDTFLVERLTKDADAQGVLRSASASRPMIEAAAELTALMRDLANRGYWHNDKVVIEPQECLEVTEHLLKECRLAGWPLDLRLQQKCFQTYLQWESDWSDSHWRDLVVASVRESTQHFRHESNTAPREDRKVHRRNILRDIMSQTTNPKKMEEDYVKQAKASRADFFRRKREVERGDFDESDAVK